MVSNWLPAAIRVRGTLVTAVLVCVIVIGPLSCTTTSDQRRTDSNERDSVNIQPQDFSNHQVLDVVEDVSKKSNKDNAINRRSNEPDPNEMYYFAPEYSQNDKSSIVGRRLGVQTLEDLLDHNVEEESENGLDLYKVPDLNNIELPIRASYSSMITIFNPYSELLRVTKLFGGGSAFHLSLPSGQMKDERNVWDIMPYQTKSVVRFTFSEGSKKNHSTNIRLYLSNRQYITVPINIVTTPKPGLYSPERIMDFGVSSESGPVKSKLLNLCSSAMSTIVVQNVTSDSYFLTVDFPRVIEIPPQSCTSSHVANISFHWNQVGYYSYDEPQHGHLTVNSNKGNDLNIPYYGKTLKGELVYNEKLLHFVMSKEIPSTSIVKNFSLLNSFSSTTVAISQIVISEDATDYFKIGQFKPVVLTPGQNKTLFHVGYINPDKLKNSIVSHLKIKTNASDITVPLMVYNGKLLRILPVNNMIAFPPIVISSPRHTYVVVANKNPVAITIENWGTSLPPHVLLHLVEIGKFNLLMYHNTESSWSRPKVYEDQTIPPVNLEVDHFAIFQLLVTMPNQNNNFTVETWIQTQYHRYSVLLKLSVLERNLLVTNEPLTFNNCHPGTICTADVNIMSKTDKILHFAVLKSSLTANNVRFIPKIPSFMYPQTMSLIGHIEWIPDNCKKSSKWIGLLSKTERAMWLSSINLTRSSEVSRMDFSWFFNRLNNFQRESSYCSTIQQYYLETDGEDNEECLFDVHFNLRWPKFVEENGKNQQQTVIELPTMEVDGIPHYQKILLKNTFNAQNVTFQLVLYPDPYQCNITEFKNLLEHEVNTLSLSRNDWSLVMDNSSPYRRKSLRAFNTKYVPHNKTMVFVLPSQKQTEVLVRFQPKRPGTSTSIIFVRNDATILESVFLKGRGAYPVLYVGPKKKLNPLIFDMKSVSVPESECGKKNIKLPTKTRIFFIKNASKHIIKIISMTIDGALCSNNIFKILDCTTFNLLPDQSKKVSVEFTPDLTRTSVTGDLEINVEEKINPNTVIHVLIYKLWSIMPSKWKMCMESHPDDRDSWFPFIWDLSVNGIIIMSVTLILLMMAIRIILKVLSNRKLKYKNRKMKKLIMKNRTPTQANVSE